MRQAWTLAAPLQNKHFAWIDKLASPLQQAVHDIFRASPQGQQVKNWLNGVPLRHRVHPALVAVPIGSWSAAALFDLLDSWSPETPSAHGKSADICIAFGIAGALPSAATGLADWVDTYDHPQRVGMAHALCNGAALVLYTASLGMRLAGQRRTGRTLAHIAFGSMAVGGSLGGELVYNLGVGVTHLLYPRPPVDFVDVLASDELPAGQPVVVEVERIPVLLLRDRGVIAAVEAWCPHAGGELHKGTFSDGVVECPLHGATFRLEDGCPLAGPASAPLRTFAVREQAGRIAVAPSYEGQSWPPAPEPPSQTPIRI